MIIMLIFWFKGNLGDSRAVLCEDHNAIQLSEDHNLDNQSENIFVVLSILININLVLIATTDEKNRILKLIKDHYDYENLFNEVTNDGRIFGSKVTRSLCSISPQHITCKYLYRVFRI